MKGKGFHFRLFYGFSGIRAALRFESSFRIQVFAALLTLISIFLLRPPLIWTALIVIMICLVLFAELFNTALEHTLDGLHPNEASFVKIAKDCSAGAVLILSLSALVVYILMLVTIFGLEPTR